MTPTLREFSCTRKITLNSGGQTTGVALELLISSTEDMITWTLEYFMIVIQKLQVSGAIYRKLKLVSLYVKILFRNNVLCKLVVIINT